MGSEEAILIDSGTAWYQLLQQERIVGQLGEDLNFEKLFSPHDAIHSVEVVPRFQSALKMFQSKLTHQQFLHLQQVTFSQHGPTDSTQICQL